MQSKIGTKLSELLHESNRAVQSDMPWCLQRDGFAQINMGTTVYPVFYERHVTNRYVWLNDPKTTNHPWVFDQSMIYQCPDLAFDSNTVSYIGQRIGVNPTNPNFIIVLPEIVVNELRGIETFAFAVPRSQIQPYIG